LVEHKDNFSYYLKSDQGGEDVDLWIEAIKYSKYSVLKVIPYRVICFAVYVLVTTRLLEYIRAARIFYPG
jgi:hypothetical protein